MVVPAMRIVSVHSKVNYSCDCFFNKVIRSEASCMLAGMLSVSPSACKKLSCCGVAGRFSLARALALARCIRRSVGESIDTQRQKRPQC